MNILHVIASMNPTHGGVCQALRNSIPALLNLGCSNEVVSFDLPGAEYLGQDRFPVHPIGPTIGPYAYCKRLSQWLSVHSHRFDALIIHGLWLYSSYGTYQALLQIRKRNTGIKRFPKCFVMPHGMLDPYFQQAKDRRLKALRNWLFWKVIESQVVNGADGLLFTCEEEKLLARKPFVPYHPKRELVVGMGIQPPPHYHENMRRDFLQKSPSVRTPYLLFLSRIHPKKGVDMLIQAYRRLWKLDQSLCTLVIAGPGLDTEYGKEIQHMAAACPQIKFAGMLAGNAKWGALYGCEAFILPSHQENFGVAIVEAMACGKPVLISNKVNIWREIEADGGGLVGADTEESTYLSLKTWHEFKREKKEAMASAAKKTFESRFAIDNAATNLINALKETP